MNRIVGRPSAVWGCDASSEPGVTQDAYPEIVNQVKTFTSFAYGAVRSE
jgi:hypothetical protein